MLEIHKDTKGTDEQVNTNGHIMVVCSLGDDLIGELPMARE